MMFSLIFLIHYLHSVYTCMHAWLMFLFLSFVAPIVFLLLSFCSGKGHHKKQVSSNLSQWLEEDDDEEPENSTALLTYKSPTSMNTGASHHKASASTSSVSLSYNGSRKGSGDSGSMQKTKSAKTMPKQPQNQTQQQQQPSFVFTSSVSALWEWNGTQYQRVCEGPLGCVILGKSIKLACGKGYISLPTFAHERFVFIHPSTQTTRSIFFCSYTTTNEKPRQPSL